MEGFEGSSVAGAGSFEVDVRIGKTDFAGIWTGSKSISYLCKGSS